ncbi:MAG: IS66 family transposase [Granulosicoccaceae bacterium]
MQSLIDKLPTNVAQLQQLLIDKQAIIERQDKALTSSQALNKVLEEQLRLLNTKHFSKSSEKNPGQAELQFLNEAELLLSQNAIDQAKAGIDAQIDAGIEIPAHKRKRKKKRQLPSDLPRCEVIHDLTDEQKQCLCGLTMNVIGEEVLEQLAIVPQQFYVIVNRKLKYACTCKGCMRTASMPVQPIPGSQASAQIIAHIMVSKFHDGLPLYRQEKIAKRENVDLDRSKQARWTIDGGKLFQPIWNCLQDSFYSYDIALADETGIQVLKEQGRKPENKSYLWIRRGGPPDKPVVLVDYSPSRAGDVATGLLEHFKGYLVVDGYSGYNAAVRKNQLKPVYCNDHARRKFVDVVKSLSKDLSEEAKQGAKNWIASQAIELYKSLYRVETLIKKLPPEKKYTERQRLAVPLWETFMMWANRMLEEGVAHEGTRKALVYLINHSEGLRRYCEDGRLPISNIQAEHVAKAIAVPRKNFLFADTPAGAEASAMIYSLLETAKINDQHPQRYLSVLLTEIPNAQTAEDIEALLPWNITPEEVNRRYAAYPTP